MCCPRRVVRSNNDPVGFESNGTLSNTSKHPSVPPAIDGTIDDDAIEVDALNGQIVTADIQRGITGSVDCSFKFISLVGEHTKPVPDVRFRDRIFGIFIRSELLSVIVIASTAVPMSVPRV